MKQSWPCRAMEGLTIFFSTPHRSRLLVSPPSLPLLRVRKSFTCPKSRYCSRHVFPTAALALAADITTGVVRALEAVADLNTVLEPNYKIIQQLDAIGLLGFFCVPTNLGMKESGSFAKVIFLIHLATLTLLTVLGTIHVIFNLEKLVQTWDTTTPSYPSIDMAGHAVEGTVWAALFYGLGSARLGCSGFETSFLFVEEQAPGVFPKTLRNMWLGIMVYNPLLSLIFILRTLPGTNHGTPWNSPSPNSGSCWNLGEAIYRWHSRFRMVGLAFVAFYQHWCHWTPLWSWQPHS